MLQQNGRLHPKWLSGLSPTHAGKCDNILRPKNNFPMLKIMLGEKKQETRISGHAHFLRGSTMWKEENNINKCT